MRRTRTLYHIYYTQSTIRKCKRTLKQIRIITLKMQKGIPRAQREKSKANKNATVCMFVTRKGVNAQYKRHGIRTRVYI